VTEKINHPPHYGGDVKFEAIKVIDDWGLGFSAGNALKYILRAPHKGAMLEDLQKAQWYLRHAAQIDEGFTLNAGRLIRALAKSIGLRARRDVVLAETPSLDSVDVADYWQLSQGLADAIGYICDRRYEEAEVVISNYIWDLGKK
jgi:hypothetical protein